MIVKTNSMPLILTYQPDFDADVTRLCQAFSEESLNEYGLGVAQERLSQMTEVCKQVSYFLRVDEKIVGLIAGCLVNNLTNGAPALQEVIWFVDKDYRRYGLLLLQAFEEGARKHGCKQIVMGLMCNSMAERLGRLYVRLGYKPFEIQYLKSLE